MNGLLLLIISLVLLGLGYVFYGRYLCKQWGVGEGDPTPAHTMEDGVDYVPAKAPVLMGHHFSSIAGAGPITGPIQAAVFGWLPCLLWIVIGGIFFGGVHDFGSLFASVRHGGRSIGEIINENMSKRAKRLFIIFAYLTLILVIAAFASIVAGTFGVNADSAPEAAEANSRVAMVSILFIVIAIFYGLLLNRTKISMGISTIIGIVAIVGIIALGMVWHPIALSGKTWMWLIGVYIVIASVAPVWILLQPRDFLSSFLLYAMLALALVGVILARPDMGTMDTINVKVPGKPIFPVLFTTIACGAISGFHSLVSSGTTSKQLDKEAHAKPIAYGGMLLECVLAVLTLCAVAYAKKYDLQGATNIFGGGIAHMIDDSIPGTFNVLNTLLILTYSAFCLTSLDTATRLARFMFQEFWLDAEKGETVQNVGGFKKVLTNPYVATIITVVLGIVLGLTGYAKIWALFGSANQLLAALALMAIAAWLGNIGKNNKMIFFPMIFMLIVTIASLVINTIGQFKAITAGGADWGPYAQAIIGILLIVLAVFLAIEGVQTFVKQSKKVNA
ncbi:MAG: carbon starvation protein A [Oscillospiraceae bacterium]|nr:carbon starvation protein A [Oscillospiraceae bacterium]